MVPAASLEERCRSVVWQDSVLLLFRTGVALASAFANETKSCQIILSRGRYRASREQVSAISQSRHFKPLSNAPGPGEPLILWGPSDPLPLPNPPGENMGAAFDT
jgi:hypothetical protein